MPDKVEARLRVYRENFHGDFVVAWSKMDAAAVWKEHFPNRQDQPEQPIPFDFEALPDYARITLPGLLCLRNTFTCEEWCARVGRGVLFAFD